MYRRATRRPPQRAAFRRKSRLLHDHVLCLLWFQSIARVRQAKFRAHHEKRLEEISRRAPGTGTVDNTPPYTAHLVHLKTRPKKKAILAARDAEVERANRCGNATIHAVYALRHSQQEELRALVTTHLDTGVVHHLQSFRPSKLYVLRDLLRQMTKIFTAPSALLPITDSAEGRGNGLGPCLSINVLCRKRELERIALENKTWVSTPTNLDK